MRSDSTLLTPIELAQALKVPLGTLYYWTSRCEIPFLKIGRHLRFDLKAVHEWFQKWTKQCMSLAIDTIRNCNFHLGDK